VVDLNAANGERVKYENLYGKVNTGYQNDGQPATAKVTFNPNPAHTPDIALNYSSMTKVRPVLLLSQQLSRRFYTLFAANFDRQRSPSVIVPATTGDR